MCNLRSILAEFVVHVAQPPSPTSDTPVSGDTPTPTPRRTLSPDQRRRKLYDGLSHGLMAHVMAGAITRTQAWDIDNGRITLEEAIAVHVPIHEKIGAVLPSIENLEDPAALHAKHAVFKGQLCKLHIEVQTAFSIGRITFLQALYAHRARLGRAAIKRNASNGWADHEPDHKVWSAPFIPYTRPVRRSSFVAGSGLCGAYNYDE